MTAPARRGKIQALDGLRAVAIVIVILHHLLPGDVLGGGVDVFFVLSGYLITAILLREHAKRGRIDVRGFLLRRLLRLYPALVVLATIVGLTLALTGLRRFAAEQVATALSYTFDIYIPLTGHSIGTLGHTWSLSLEQQFYLTWPLLVILIVHSTPSLWRRFAVVATLAVVGVASQFIFYAHTLNFSPQARVGSLFVGCALAFFLAARPVRLGRGWLVGCAVGYLALCVLADALKVIGHIWVSPVSALLSLGAVWVLATAHDEGVALLTNRVSVHVGGISYGLFLWHFPILYFLFRTHSPLWLVAAVSLPATLAAAEASKYFIENPFLAIKERLSAKSVEPQAPQSQLTPEVAV